MKTMRVTPLLCFPLQSNCVRECFKQYLSLPRPTPTEPGKVLADAKNDPQDPHPSFGPERVSLVCLIASFTEYFSQSP